MEDAQLGNTDPEDVEDEPEYIDDEPDDTEPEDTDGEHGSSTPPPDDAAELEDAQLGNTDPEDIGDTDPEDVDVEPEDTDPDDMDDEPEDSDAAVSSPERGRESPEDDATMCDDAAQRIAQLKVGKLQSIASLPFFKMVPKIAI